MSSSLRLVVRRAAVAATAAAARPAALNTTAMRAICTSRPLGISASSSSRSSSSSSDFPWDRPQEEGAAIEDGTEGFTPRGAPWTPNPVAEDYEETLQILLGANKVEDAIDIFGRMLKRGFRPSSETVNTLYELAKSKPEYQAAAVKALKGLDLSSFK